MPRQTLYRHFNAEGRLLYVGVSSRISRRVKEHSKHSPWWQDISRIELEHFDDRGAVLSAERDAIAKERPLHNIHHVKQAVSEQKITALLAAKDMIVARIVTLRPLYKISEAGEALGVGTTMIRREIEAGRLGYIDLPSPKGTKVIRYVSGWHILDWLEPARSTQARIAA